MAGDMFAEKKIGIRAPTCAMAARSKFRLAGRGNDQRQVARARIIQQRLRSAVMGKKSNQAIASPAKSVSDFRQSPSPEASTAAASTRFSVRFTSCARPPHVARRAVQ